MYKTDGISISCQVLEGGDSPGRLTVLGIDNDRIEVTRRGEHDWSVTFDGRHYDFDDVNTVHDFVIGRVTGQVNGLIGHYLSRVGALSRYYERTQTKEG